MSRNDRALTPTSSRSGIRSRWRFVVAIVMLLWSAASAPGQPIDRFFRVRQDQRSSAFIDPSGRCFFSIGLNVLNPVDTERTTGPKYDGLAKHDGDLNRWQAATHERLRTWGFNTIGAWSSLRGAPYVVELSLKLFVDRRVRGRVRGLRPQGGSPQPRPAACRRIVRLPRRRPAPDRLLHRQRAGLGLGTRLDRQQGRAVAVRILLDAEARLARQEGVGSFPRGDLSRRLAPAVRSVERRGRQRSGASPRQRDRPSLAGSSRRGSEGQRSVPASRRRAVLPGDQPRDERSSAPSPESRLPADAQVARPWSPRRRADIAMSFRESTSTFRATSGALREELVRLHAIGKKPVLLSEFSYPARANRSGNTNKGYERAEVENECERGELYARTVRMLSKMPFLVGAHWFQYFDEPTQGREDSENVNFGFVDFQDRVYVDLAAAASGANRETQWTRSPLWAPNPGVGSSPCIPVWSIGRSIGNELACPLRGSCNCSPARRPFASYASISAG